MLFSNIGFSYYKKKKKKKKKKTKFKINGSYRVDTMLNGFHGSCWVTREIAVLCGVWSPDLLT